MDIFLVTERTIEDGMLFAHVRRSFFPTEDYYAELHSAIIGGVQVLLIPSDPGVGYRQHVRNARLPSPLLVGR